MVSKKHHWPHYFALLTWLIATILLMGKQLLESSHSGNISLWPSTFPTTPILIKVCLQKYLLYSHWFPHSFSWALNFSVLRQLETSPRHIAEDPEQTPKMTDSSPKIRHRGLSNTGDTDLLVTAPAMSVAYFTQKPYTGIFQICKMSAFW